MASDVFLQQKKERYSKFGLDSHILHTRTLHIHSLSLSLLHQQTNLYRTQCLFIWLFSYLSKKWISFPNPNILSQILFAKRCQLTKEKPLINAGNDTSPFFLFSKRLVMFLHFNFLKTQLYFGLCHKSLARRHHLWTFYDCGLASKLSYKSWPNQYSEKSWNFVSFSREQKVHSISLYFLHFFWFGSEIQNLKKSQQQEMEFDWSIFDYTVELKLKE